MLNELFTLMAARRGHFRLESGHHGELWLDVDRLFTRPERVRRHATAPADGSPRTASTSSAAPSPAAAFLGQMVAEELGAAFVYANRVEYHASPPSYSPSPTRSRPSSRRRPQSPRRRGQRCDQRRLRRPRRPGLAPCDRRTTRRARRPAHSRRRTCRVCLRRRSPPRIARPRSQSHLAARRLPAVAAGETVVDACPL